MGVELIVFVRVRLGRPPDRVATDYYSSFLISPSSHYPFSHSASTATPLSHSIRPLLLLQLLLLMPPLVGLLPLFFQLY